MGYKKAMQRDEGPECMALDYSYKFRILLELELVGEGELESEVLAVEIDLALVENLGETEGVAGIDHEVTLKLGALAELADAVVSIRGAALVVAN